MEELEPKPFRNKFSAKFYVGIVLIVLSLVIGKITLAIFILYFNDDTAKSASMIIYALSWPMLLLGVWWVGKEYADKVKRYFDYKYYQRHLIKGTVKAYQLTKKLSLTKKKPNFFADKMRPEKR